MFGAKRRLNGTSKLNTQTNTQTNMDILTYRKHLPRGPMLCKMVFTFCVSINYVLFIIETTTNLGGSNKEAKTVTQ